MILRINMIYLRNLRFSKKFFSNDKADKNSNPSLKSCLLRIPSSINSKYDTKVTIIQKWNGYRRSISEEVLEEFRTYLIQKKINDYNYRQKIMKIRRYTNTNKIKIITMIITIGSKKKYFQIPLKIIEK